MERIGRGRGIAFEDEMNRVANLFERSFGFEMFESKRPNSRLQGEGALQ